MSVVVEYLNLASTGSAALCLLVAMLFIDSPNGWLRAIIVGIAVLAIAAPIVHLQTTLGSPSPWLENGRYRLLGWKTDEEAGQIYIMVTHSRFDTPREFQVPFDLDLALELQDIRDQKDYEELLCMKYDTTADGKPPVQLRRIQSAVMDLYQSCNLMWSDK